MAWPKGQKRPKETIDKIRTTRATNRARREAASAADADAGATPGRSPQTTESTPAATQLHADGARVVIDEAAPGRARVVAGSSGKVEHFVAGEYSVRLGPKLVVKVPAAYVRAAARDAVLV